MSRKRTTNSKDRRRRMNSLYNQQNGLCFYCDAVFLPLEYYRELLTQVSQSRRARECNFPTVDHIVPAVYGGSGRLDNLVLACKVCNHTKDDWIIPEYIWRDRDELAMLLQTGECKYGAIHECCGNDAQFRILTKQEIIGIW